MYVLSKSFSVKAYFNEETAWLQDISVSLQCAYKKRFCLSVDMWQLENHWTDYYEICYRGILLTYAHKLRILLKQRKKIDALHENLPSAYPGRNSLNVSQSKIFITSVFRKRKNSFLAIYFV
jgi:hypothetical protein